VFNQLDWNPAYSIETLEPNTVFFLSERESICFQEPLYYRLVRLIDGQRNLDEIIDILQFKILSIYRQDIVIMVIINLNP
jgi:ribosomal protein S12 methylthiotransferase accessory factor